MMWPGACEAFSFLGIDAESSDLVGSSVLADVEGEVIDETGDPSAVKLSVTAELEETPIMRLAKA